MKYKCIDLIAIWTYKYSQQIVYDEVFFLEKTVYIIKDIDIKCRDVCGKKVNISKLSSFLCFI
jgi:hypothetical protein